MEMDENRIPSDETGGGRGRGVIRAAVAAGVIAGFLGGAIVVDGAKISVTDNAAFAKGGNGGGKGGGRGGGGGHGGGNKGSHGSTADAGKARGHAKGHGHGHKDGLAHVDGHDHGQGHGRGHSKGHGHGHRHARGDDDANGRSDPPGVPSLDKGASENGISAAALGSLNAAHASATARENASPNSMVGHIAAFADAVESENVNAAAEALAAKANKSITTEVVTEVARQAEVEVSPETASAIAARAAELQAEERREPAGESMPGGS